MEYIIHLRKDKRFVPLLTEEPYILVQRTNTPLRLMASIMSQQLSTKVAAVIYSRFLGIFNGKEPTVKQVLATPPGILRAVGLSNAKVQYILNVAGFFITNSVTDKKLAKMSNEEIIALLTQIKGVGKWTVEMLLMFSLGRPDVFAVDDLGIQQAMTKLYRLNPENKKEMKEKMLRLAARWSPYRTYACVHLWKWKDV